MQEEIQGVGQVGCEVSDSLLSHVIERAVDALNHPGERSSAAAAAVAIATAVQFCILPRFSRVHFLALQQIRVDAVPLALQRVVSTEQGIHVQNVTIIQ
jgi:hypothetical protein